MESVELKKGWVAYAYVALSILALMCVTFLIGGFAFPKLIYAVVNAEFGWFLLFLFILLVLVFIGFLFPYVVWQEFTNKYTFTQDQLIRENHLFSSQNYIHHWVKTDKVFVNYESGKGGGYYLVIKTEDNQFPIELPEGYYSNLQEAADFAMRCVGNAEEGSYHEQREAIFEREVKDVKKWIIILIVFLINILFTIYKYYG